MRPVTPIDWLIQPETVCYQWWCHLCITSDDVIRPPMAGNLRRFWVTLMTSAQVPFGQVRSGLKQAISNKFDLQYWGIEPHTSGVHNWYQPTNWPSGIYPTSHSGQSWWNGYQNWAVVDGLCSLFWFWPPHVHMELWQRWTSCLLLQHQKST